MKLLYCDKCKSVFSLSKTEKTCECGVTKGKYTDNLNAEYSGEYAIPLGFRNDAFAVALCLQPKEGQGEDFTAFVIPKQCNTFKKI